MSMITTETTSATLPANGRKIITGINVAGILGCILPPEIGREDVIRARNVKLSYEMAHSAITGQKSAIAFVQGLAFCAVVFSHGNKFLTQLQSGAPAWVQALLANVTQYFKCGAGDVTRYALEIALDEGIKLTLALPAPAKSVKDTTNGKVITSTSTAVDEPIDLATGRIKVHSLAFGHEAHEDGIRITDVDLMAKPSIDAKAREMAVERAKAQYEKEAINVVRLVAELSDKDQALGMIKEMALAFGYRLAKIPAKKTA